MKNRLFVALVLSTGCFSEVPATTSGGSNGETSGTSSGETDSSTSDGSSTSTSTSGASTSMDTSDGSTGTSGGLPDVGDDETGGSTGAVSTTGGSTGGGSTGGEVPENGPYAVCISTDPMSQCDIGNTDIDPNTQCASNLQDPAVCVYWLLDLAQTVDDCAPHPAGYSLALYEPNDPPGGARYCAVTCVGGAECPPGWTCHPSLDLGFTVIPTDICWPD